MSHIMKRMVMITALFVGLSCFAAENPTFPKLPDSPSKLIEILKGAGERYTIGDVRVDYVKESDLQYLVSLLDSKDPCRFVDMPDSSIYYPGKSTVGHEAAYLIEGFWKRYYPTGLTSQQYKPDTEAIKRWYGQWSRLKKLSEGGAGNGRHPAPFPFEHRVFAPDGHSVAGTFMLCFSLTNVSASAINPLVTESSLRVNGKELASWPFTIANGPRDDRWESLPPGDHLEFCYAMGAPPFTSHGVYDVVWLVQGRASKPFRIEVK
jgi:hypothetical protein